MPQFIRDDEVVETAERLPVLPLRDVVVFPYAVMPLLVGRAASLAAVNAGAGEAGGYVLLVAQKSGDVHDPASADLHRVGTIGRIVQLTRLGGGTTKVLVEGVARARVTRYLPATGCLRAVVEPLPFADLDTGPYADPEGAPGAAPDAPSSEREAAGRRTLALFEEYVALQRRVPEEVAAMVQQAEGEARRAFGVAAHLAVRHEVKQAVLETLRMADVWSRLGELLQSEIEILRLERKIEDDVRGSLFQNQREFYLQEQLKAIHRELGGEEAEDADELERQIEARSLPPAVKTRALREVRKLRRMSPLSPESTVGRNFLDWLLALPWTERTDEVLDVVRARAVLDEDHYGLDEVKERILDHIAVLALVGKLSGPILCLVGPPGVGKTSLGRSIARALGRRFVRMSLGGVRDEAEIRGHRRTYIGAMPGRVIQAMRRAETINPVLLLDEVDKLGQDYRGDPSAALLEVLDPEQNAAFNDHYLEVDYDLSQVLFITTANSLATIPEPLRDRTEIIRLAGYLDQEKLAIARQHLLPKTLRAAGIAPETVTWEAAALLHVLRGYTREAGVREFERRLSRMSRKLARRRAEHPDRAATMRDEVTLADVRSMLGPAPFDPDDASLEDKVGVATGLAYTPAGGETLEIEVSIVPGRGRVQLTGTLGDVMKESATAALSYARARAAALGLDRDFYKTRDVHVHIPAGATPKDGPSAGIAIATAVVSALTNAPVRGDIAMTGEITLRGRVLPIGGLKEKSVAAHRNGIAMVLIPAGNEREVEELPEEVRDAVRFHAVRSMDDVLGVALRGDLRAVAKRARGERRERAKARADAERPMAH